MIHHETKYKSIFISDIHLGTHGCQADHLIKFLKNNTCENLFLVGDVIDGWRLKNRWYFPQNHVNVIRRIFTAAKRGANVYYILGNHDEVFRKFLSFGIDIGRIRIVNELDYVGIDGKKYLIVHGDAFDKLMTDGKWLMHIGDTLYNMAVMINTKFNTIRGWLGMEYWSLSKWLKKNTKQALNYIHRYEDHVAEHCEKHGYDGIVCGHIHTAEMRKISGIMYMNCGDWVESCTAIVENHDGVWRMVNWREENAIR